MNAVRLILMTVALMGFIGLSLVQAPMAYGRTAPDSAACHGPVAKPEQPSPQKSPSAPLGVLMPCCAHTLTPTAKLVAPFCRYAVRIHWPRSGEMAFTPFNPSIEPFPPRSA